eukprot:4865295-Amphidinium_carterae.3
MVVDKEFAGCQNYSAPELFHVEDCVTRDKTPHTGRQSRLTDAHVTILADMVHKITAEVPMSAHATTELLNVQLDSIIGAAWAGDSGVDQWTRSFIKDLGLNWRVFIQKSSARIRFLRRSPQCDATMHCHNVSHKLRYFQKLQAIPDSRICNLEETAVRLTLH